MYEIKWILIRDSEIHFQAYALGIMDDLSIYYDALQIVIHRDPMPLINAQEIFFEYILNEKNYGFRD